MQAVSVLGPLLLGALPFPALGQDAPSVDAVLAR